MDLAKVLHQLHEELEHIDAAIASLERLHAAGKGRARAPDWLLQVGAQGAEPKKARRRKAPGSPGE